MRGQWSRMFIVINTEAFIPQHELFVRLGCWRRLRVRSRQAFVSRIKVWRLKEAVRDKFREVVERMVMSKNTCKNREQRARTEQEYIIGAQLRSCGQAFVIAWLRQWNKPAGEQKGGRCTMKLGGGMRKWIELVEKRDWYGIWSKSKIEEVSK